MGTRFLTTRERNYKYGKGKNRFELYDIMLKLKVLMWNHDFQYRSIRNKERHKCVFTNVFSSFSIEKGWKQEHLNGNKHNLNPDLYF